MTHPTVLLIGKHAEQTGPVADLLRRTRTVDLATVDDLDQAYAYPDWDRVALVLIGHDRRGSTNGIVRLLRMLAAARRPVATVILGEGLDEATEAHLLRRGAAHCLLAPFDLNRLAYLVEILTLRAREASGPSRAGEGAVAWDESDPLVAQARRVADAGRDRSAPRRGGNG